MKQAKYKKLLKSTPIGHTREWTALLGTFNMNRLPTNDRAKKKFADQIMKDMKVKDGPGMMICNLVRTEIYGSTAVLYLATKESNYILDAVDAYMVYFMFIIIILSQSLPSCPFTLMSSWHHVVKPFHQLVAGLLRMVLEGRPSNCNVCMYGILGRFAVALIA